MDLGLRDFNIGRDINVNGNFNILDNSINDSKLLINCTNVELRDEMKYREDNIKLEQSRKIKRHKPYYLMVAILFIISAFISAYYGLTDLITLSIGIPTMICGVMSLNSTLKDNFFQIANKQEIKEIKHILLCRRVE